jgi:hypothetical protein
MIKEHGFTGKVVCNELEREWVETSTHNVDEWHIGDAANMAWAESNSFDAICTSPTYGNRMADHHNAKDGSKRVTYKHFLGRDLNEANTGKMQWGENYRQKHLEIYKECGRVLKKWRCLNYKKNSLLLMKKSKILTKKCGKINQLVL